MKFRFIDWIWRVKGSLALDPPRSPANAFERLRPLLEANGTTYEISGDTLTYSKDNPAAQDKMATFTRGTLRVVDEQGRASLRYDLKSHALLLCFLAPLLFLAFAQATIIVSDLEGPIAEDADEDAEEEEKEVPQLHPLDVALGAPAPEKPDEKDKADEEREGEKKKHSPTAAYVFAAIFAALYVAGRILEPWLIRSTFRKALSDVPAADDASPGDNPATQQSG